jgi:predicted NAD-dependent protein-ADP-ribosyltransferase YbiA (DUF1768 family)
MVSHSGTRGGRTRRKRHARRKQRTHRKQRSHRNKLRRQSGGAAVLYFYEAYEEKSGFLTNFYTRMVGTSCQAGSSEHFDYLFKTYESIPFMYKPSNMDEKIPFYNSEQAFSYEKALFCAKDPKDPTKDPQGAQLEELDELLKKIQNTPDPYIIKAIGSFDGYKEGDKIWKLIKNRPDAEIWPEWTITGVGYMEAILREKFKPVGDDREMLDMLVQTGDQYLAEEWDPHWGIGYERNMADKLRKDDANGNPFWEKAGRDGVVRPCTNHLGKILMKIREENK